MTRLVERDLQVLMIRLAVLTQITSVTNGQTERQTGRIAIKLIECVDELKYLGTDGTFCLRNHSKLVYIICVCVFFKVLIIYMLKVISLANL